MRTVGRMGWLIVMLVFVALLLAPGCVARTNRQGEKPTDVPFVAGEVPPGQALFVEHRWVDLNCVMVEVPSSVYRLVNRRLQGMLADCTTPATVGYYGERDKLDTEAALYPIDRIPFARGFELLAVSSDGAVQIAVGNRVVTVPVGESFVLYSRANECENGLTDVESESLLNHGLLAVEQIDLACEVAP